MRRNIALQRQHHWIRTLSGFGAALSNERRVLPIRINEKNMRKWDVIRVSSQNIGCERTYLRGLRYDRRTSCKFAQSPKPALTDDIVCHFVYSGQHSANSAWGSIVGHRTVSDSEMSLLYKPVAVDFQSEIVRPCGNTAQKRTLDQWPDDVPDLWPALGRG